MLGEIPLTHPGARGVAFIDSNEGICGVAKDNISQEMLSRIAEMFRALSDEVRLRLMLRLRRGEANVTRLVEELGVGQASVSKHLATLRRAGLVTVRREGNHAIYSVRDQSVFQVCHLVCECVKRQHAENSAALEGEMDFQI